jgi:hypothetical protein
MTKAPSKSQMPAKEHQTQHQRVNGMVIDDSLDLPSVSHCMLENSCLERILSSLSIPGPLDMNIEPHSCQTFRYPVVL